MRKLFVLLLLQCTIAGSVVAQPTITSFAPLKGNPGTIVTITGTNFSTSISQNIVYFGGARGLVLTSSATSITVLSPVGATYKPISVFNKTTNLVAYSKKFFTPTFSPRKGSLASTDFLAKVDFTGTSVFGGVIKKLNALTAFDAFGSGRNNLYASSDIISSGSEANNNIFPFNNTSVPGSIDSTSFSISFAASASADGKAGTRPQAVSYGDLDQDGNLELMAAVYGGNNVYLQLSVGNPTFRTFSTGAGTFDVAACDIDQDGKTDIISANALAFGISVLRNTNSATQTYSFASAVNFVAGFQPVGLAIGDIDGDGKEDAAVINTNIDSTFGLSILRNTSVSGTVSFAPFVNFTTGPAPRGIALADIDGDGKLDVVVANQKRNTVSILRNNSTSGVISFQAKVDFAVGNKPKGVAVGDLDGDGKLDIVVSNTKSNNVSVFGNLATSGVIDASSLATPFTLTTAAFPASVIIADVDMDGRPDIETANYNAGSVTVLKNEPGIIGIAPSKVIAQEIQDRFDQFLNAAGRDKIFGASISPNPAADVATLSFNKQQGPVSINLTNINGDNLWHMEKTETNMLQLPVSNLAPGLYFVNISSVLGSTTVKFIKQ